MDEKFRTTRLSSLIFLAMLAACGSGGGSGGGAPAESPSSGAAPQASGVASPSSGTEPSLARREAPTPGTVEFFATFPNLGQFRANPDPVVGMSDDGMWWVEQKTAGRAVVVEVGRDGGSGLRLHTEPGDDFVSGSDTHERNDVALQDTDGVQGREHWWAHSILFPEDYVVPPSGPGSRGVVFDFHDTRNQGGQANFHIFVEPGGRMTFRGHGGPTAVMSDAGNEYSYGTDIGPLEKNVWYDFVYHVKWSSNSDGFFQAWVNGVLKLDHRGPTLYQGYGVILKLANYHSAFGQGSSVIHDRVIRGTTWQVVSLTPLEGVSP